MYRPIEKEYYTKDTVKEKFGVLTENFILYKTLLGDNSDKVPGVKGLGKGKIFKLFPELLDKEVNIIDILTKGELLLKEDKDNQSLKNLLSGRTKDGIFGDEYYKINKKLVDLSEPLISEEGKELVESYYSESMDPDGRGHRNLIRFMMNDGFFKYLPKGDDAWVSFLKPFLKLTRKEKTNFRNKKN